jgi:hypothetical protein
MGEVATRQYWWQQDLAGFDIYAVEAVLTRISQYNQLASGIGAAALRHAFAKDNNLQDVIDTALAALAEPIQ